MTMAANEDAARTVHDVTAAAIAARDGQLAPLAARVAALLTVMFRIGAALLALGVVLALVRGEPLSPTVDAIGSILPAILTGHAAGLVDLAILWLMAAPVVATIVVLAGFLRLGDRRYALVTALVLLVLAASIARALTR